MAYIEVRKNGKVVKRRLVDDDKAQKGCGIRVGSVGQVHLQIGQTKNVGKYEISMFVGTPDQGHGAFDQNRTKSDTFPLISQTEQTKFTGAAKDRTASSKFPLPKIEGYEITGQLGEGGMGTVWCAIELSTKREVALKFLSRHRFDSKKSRARFEREVSLAAKLTHPNIARVYHSDLYRGVYYYAMELIDGVHLDKYVQQNELSQRDILELITNVCDAIRHAHELGIIHRDLKPSNIIVTKDGEPHVVDFGLAKASMKEEDDITISIEGEITGTLAYMSPEQAAGRLDKISEQTDVYSLGVILYELLTGRLPHDISGSRYDVIKRIVEEEVESPRIYNGHIDSDLESLLLTALAKEPQDRYPSAAVLLQDIKNYLNGDPLLARSLSATYRIRKRVRKHAKTIAKAFLFLIILGAIITIAFCIVSSERKKRLEAEKLAGLQTEKVAADTKQIQQLKMSNDNGQSATLTDKDNVIVYVNKNASGLEDGSSWDNAFTTIQPAIDAASTLGGGEVWIAAGTYNEVRSNRYGSVVMRPWVNIYGGFSGTETQRDQRNWTANVTTINGSIARAGKAATHVIIGADDAILDGLTISGGRAGSAGEWEDNHGGGLFNDHNSPVIRNCRFLNNWSPASDPGGGSAIYNYFSSPLIENCRFEGNEGRHGGAIFNGEESHGKIRNCVFVNNKGNQASGAIHIVERSNPMIESCLFYRNSAGVNGGASFSAWDSSPTYINCVFWENHANREGGAIVCGSGAQVIKHCTFYGNTSAIRGGTIDVGDDIASISNSIIWNCVGGSINISNTGRAVVNSCVVQGGFAVGTNIIDQSPRFRNPQTGNFHLKADSLCIDSGNRAYAVTSDYDGRPRPVDGDADGTAVVDIGAFEFIPPSKPDEQNIGQSTLNWYPKCAPAPAAIKVKGDPFFVICVSGADVKDFSEYKQDGFNTVLLSDSNSVGFLEAEKHGLHVISQLTFDETNPPDLTQVKDRLVQDASKPSLLSWASATIWPVNSWDYKNLEPIVQEARTVSSTTPIFMSILPRSVNGLKSKIERFSYCDGFILNPNIFQKSDAKAGLPTEVSTTSFWVDQVKDVIKSKPIWTIVKRYGSTKAVTYNIQVSNNKLRSLVYLAVNHGATGIVIPAYDKELHFMYKDKMIKSQLAKELDNSSFAILSGAILDEVTISNDNGKIDFKAYGDQHQIQLIAVNTSDTEVRPTIKVPKMTGSIYTLNEDRGFPQPKGQFTDIFEPYQTHVYTIRFRQNIEQAYPDNIQSTTVKMNISEITDPMGNLEGDPNRKFLDIIHSSIKLEGENYVFSVTMESEFPSIRELGPNKKFNITWCIDTDRNTRTGRLPRGSDYKVCLIWNNNGWSSDLLKFTEDEKNVWKSFNHEGFEVNVNGNVATLTMPIMYLPSRKFNWRLISQSERIDKWPPKTINPFTQTIIFNPSSDQQ